MSGAIPRSEVGAMEWDIPEADETKARQLILHEIKQAIGRPESQS